jgi:hypothetical protein
MLMANHGTHAILAPQATQQRDQAAVLRWLEGLPFQTLQFDSNGEIVAVVASLPVRGSSVPGTLVARNVLRDASPPVDHEMRRNLQATNLLEIGVGRPIELVGKKQLNRIAAVNPWWQTDGVQNYQVN